MQNARGVWLRRPKIPRDDRAEQLAREELFQQVVHRRLEVARADPLRDPFAFQVAHERYEPGLRRLRGDGVALYAPDLLHRGFLVGGGKLVDVLEDVDAGWDADGSAHLGEHVGLGKAGCLVSWCWWSGEGGLALDLLEAVGVHVYGIQDFYKRCSGITIDLIICLKFTSLECIIYTQCNRAWRPQKWLAFNSLGEPCLQSVVNKKVS